MPNKIFICYRCDDAGFAGRPGDLLAAEFGSDGVFLDTDQLQVGRRFDSELLRALGESDIFLVVIGRQWLQALQQREQDRQADYVFEEVKARIQVISAINLY